ncbi:MAG TPA: hypothetical protein VGS62_02820 [Streptosporangiaceae bacterium]|nr:hypothetical protein [Streptosporangiaceae bacterium]
MADAVLYEGYLLYPYRRSAQKNQVRFQFGVLMPPAYSAVDPSEASASQTECLLEYRDGAVVWVLARFLHLRGDEADDLEHRVEVPVSSLLRGEADVPFHVAGLDAAMVIGAERLPGRVLRMRVRLENRTAPPEPPRSRPDALRHALISAHLLIGAEDGTFLSLTEPPEWAAPLAAGCVNTGLWPVLAGPPDCRDLVLAAPIILYDHPEVAAESAGDLFDATEIDEILTLRTLAMTDEEKAEARSTDPRAAGLLDRLEGLPPEMIEKMHGAIRYLGPAASPVEEPWWDPGSDQSVSPETDHVMVQGVRVAKGSRVRMRPGVRRADAQDLFLAGREAVVEAVLFDVDGQVHVAVSPAGDPLAGLGRFRYFAPDEIEPV